MIHAIEIERKRDPGWFRSLSRAVQVDVMGEYSARHEPKKVRDKKRKDRMRAEFDRRLERQMHRVHGIING